jgi:heme/copper-type cytochrome/quinol oxidase subunit 1
MAILLLPPLCVTILGGRSAWIWLSLGMVAVAGAGLVQLQINQFALGNVDGWLSDLLFPKSTQTSLHNTFDVTANFTALNGIVVPAFVIGALLFIRVHPRRTALDIGLFWTAIVLSFAASFGLAMILSGAGMPRRYAEYPDWIEAVSGLSIAAESLANITLFVAAARPLVSWWRARKAPDAV